MQALQGLTLLLMSAVLHAGSMPVTFSSGEQQVSLIELYTSEGCSSCPPADRFIRSLGTQKGLFSAFIPLAFHVDYWDYIGWADPYASPAFSDRQRRYAGIQNAGGIYTPGFFINGNEWRGFFRRPGNWQDTLSQKKVGSLSITYQHPTLQVEFNGTLPNDARLNTAWIGLGLTSSVQRGENRGKTLQHDFVVLEWKTNPMPASTATLTLTSPPELGQQRTGLVAWISQSNDPRPVQAVGGLLPSTITNH